MSRSLLPIPALLLAACAGGVASNGDNGESAQGLSAGETFCQILNALPGRKVGDVTIDKPDCGYINYDRNLFYLGSDRWSRLRGTPPTDRTAEATAQALMCALDAADGHTAAVTVPAGALGRFGFDTAVEIGSFDAGARTVSGQRLGRVWLFGVPLAFDTQDFTGHFPIERDGGGGGIFHAYSNHGYYMELASSRSNWSIGGSALVDFPPPIEFALKLSHGGNYLSYQNDALDWRHTDFNDSDGNYVANPSLSYDRWANTCTCSFWSCDCPTAADQQAHANIFDYANVSDGQLPWTGYTSGVIGPYAYRSPQRNWWHFGFANASGGIAGEPDQSGGDSMHLMFYAGLRYDIVLVKLQIDAGFSGGFGLFQYDAPNDGHATVEVGTHLEASAHAGVTAHVVIDNPFPLGPNPLVDADFTVLPTQTAQAADYPPRTSFVNYQGLPNATLASCMSRPIAHDITPPTNPADGLNNVLTAAQGQLYPCDVQLCKPSSDNPAAGTTQQCTWNASANRMSCIDTNQPCRTCGGTTIQLCDAQGNRMPRSHVTDYSCDTRPR